MLNEVISQIEELVEEIKKTEMSDNLSDNVNEVEYKIDALFEVGKMSDKTLIEEDELLTA